MELVSNLRSSMAATKLNTSIGDVAVSSLNNWNNTSFSKLCRGVSESELLKLSQSGDLNADKREIASNIYEQCFGESSGNHV